MGCVHVPRWWICFHQKKRKVGKEPVGHAYRIRPVLDLLLGPNVALVALNAMEGT